MKITLKKVKVYDELSEETICYTAEIHVDGKKVATVRNSGQGGSTDVYYAEGSHSDGAQRLEEYAKENPVVYNFNGHVCEFRGVDTIADKLLDEWLEKKLKRSRK